MVVGRGRARLRVAGVVAVVRGLAEATFALVAPRGVDAPSTWATLPDQNDVRPSAPAHDMEMWM